MNAALPNLDPVLEASLDLVALRALDWSEPGLAGRDHLLAVQELSRWNAGLPVSWATAFRCEKCGADGGVGPKKVPSGAQVICPKCGHSWEVVKTR